MPRTLPARPSLAQLKHQAKDLRIAAREGEPEALTIVRRIKRFAGATDQEISSTRVTLSEAQFALALDYGFSSWPELRQRVERLRGGRGRAVRRADGAMVVDGLEHARWGGGTRRQCSSIATLSLVSERLGDEVDYDYLMAASGAAFRVQMSLGRLCPSSPHATCGFNCTELAFKAWGHDVTWVETDEKNRQRRDEARRSIMEGIDRGVPALYEHEESSLIVGYTESELLLRPYSAKQAGYETMQQWPWLAGIAAESSSRPPMLRVLEDSLRLATQLFETPRVNGYACGRNAYLHWIELVTDDAMFAKMTEQDRFGAALGNAHTLECLADARGAAANFLSAVAGELQGEAAEAARAVSDEYGELEIFVRERRRELAPYPWELDQGFWPTELRQREAEALAMISERDGKAMDLLGRALRTFEAGTSSHGP